MKYIASVSFGKDSLAMLLRLIEENYPLDIVYFYNTGMEFDCIYRIRNLIKPILEERRIDFVELSYERSFEYMALEHEINHRQKTKCKKGYGWCGGPCRWGTTLKLLTISQFKKSLNDEIVDYIGIAADETHRIEKEFNPNRRMPLVEWGMTEDDCLLYCRKHGIKWIEQAQDGDIDLYDILHRVSCWCCANKNIDELRNIWKYLPHYWEKLKDMERKIGAPIHRNRGGIGYYEQRFELENKWKESGKRLNTKEFYGELRKLRDADNCKQSSWPPNLGY